MNVITQIAEAVKKLFSREIKDKVSADIAVSQSMTDAIKLWTDCYKNRSPWLTDDYKGMHLPSAIAKEMARLVTLEFKSELTGGKRAEYLSEAYKKLISDASVYTEYACAKGGVMLKPYLSGGYATHAYVQADSFFPTAFDSSGNITGCIFAERKVVGKKFYTRLETHDYTKSLYIVKNAAYLSDNNSTLGRQVPLSSVPEWSELAIEVALTNFNRPLFCYFKMPGANIIDDSSPLGVSIFSNALDAIKDADDQYSRLIWEFDGSELAVNADFTALEPRDGDFKVPKHKKRLYRGFDRSDMFETFSPDIRDQSLLNGLNYILRNVEYLSCLAFGTFSKIDDTEKTATEIKASKQRSYCTVSAIQKSLQKCLQEYLICLNDLCDFYGLAPKDKVEQSFEFDDSLVTDSETQQKILLQEVAAGVAPPVEYRMKVKGETEEQAREQLAKIDVFAGAETE
ncbi:MAG: phage portal protein [Oscillospiraceae bacterium]|nr:phage portal protein [Oscillospiraceae bacterium]